MFGMGMLNVAIFSKDDIIIKQCLIELWMANGFVSSNETLDAEDVGDGVWNELYWRSFHGVFSLVKVLLQT